MLIDFDFSEKCGSCGVSLDGQYEDPLGIDCDDCYEISKSGYVDPEDDFDEFELGGEG
jgi:hypothetical protein